MAYSRWLDARSGFEQEGHELLKEWEVTARPLGKPDLARLARYEMALGGDAGLFGAIVADRRLFMGPDCAFTKIIGGASRMMNYCLSCSGASREWKRSSTGSNRTSSSVSSVSRCSTTLPIWLPKRGEFVS